MSSSKIEFEHDVSINVRNGYAKIKGFPNHRILPSGEMETVNIYGKAGIKCDWRKVSSGNSGGYLNFHIMHNKKKIRASAHRLVALAFIRKEKEERTCVNHINGNKHDNNVANLEWVTYKENIAHARRELPRKEYPGTFLKKENIIEIIEWRFKNHNARRVDVAQKFGISKATVDRAYTRYVVMLALAANTLRINLAKEYTF